MVASTALAAGAFAKPIEHTVEFHDERTFIDHDYCEAPGLDVQVDVVSDGHILINPHGPDGLPYFHLNVSTNIVVTNLDSGTAITATERAVDKDLRVTDNGDGTLTLLIFATGNFVAYGPDGEVIARNPGQIRLEYLFDHGGTPTDPYDDEFLEDLGEVKGSTGRTDDFCEAAVPALEA